MAWVVVIRSLSCSAQTLVVLPLRQPAVGIWQSENSCGITAGRADRCIGNFCRFSLNGGLAQWVTSVTTAVKIVFDTGIVE